MKAFLILLLCYSCTKYASVSKESVGIQIHPVKMDISHLNEIDWHIGQKKEETVSQSVTFIVHMPKVKKEDLEYLTSQKGIDSWIVRLIVVRGSESQDLGSLYAKFNPRKVSRTSSSTSATSSVTLKVYYAAAYASERFRSFKCPAFGHNKRIKEASIKGENQEFEINIGQTFPYNEKSHLVELTPSAFNAGNSLVGDYFLEIAPYDSKNKMIHSSFKRIPMYVNIAQEESVSVRSCEGIHSEKE
jgi:hypothetical protein